MRRIQFCILATTAIALVSTAASEANPIQPGMSGPSASTARARPPGYFRPSDPTVRSRTVAPLRTHQPNARIIATPQVPPARTEQPAQSVSPVMRNEPPPMRARPLAPAVQAQPPAPPVRAAQPAAPVVRSAPPSQPVMSAMPPRPAAVSAPAVVTPAVATPAPAAEAEPEAVSAPPREVSQPAKPKPAVAAGFAASDSDVADKVRELIASKQLERMVPRKNERDAIETLYVKNRSMPLWYTGGTPSERARDAMAHLAGIDADGLDPSEYPVDLAARSVEDLAEAELRTTAILLTYARHAMGGRVHFSRVSPNIDYKSNFNAADTMAKIADATDLRRTLAGFNPPQPGYRALKEKLAEMRGKPAEAGDRIPDGPVLRYGRDRSGRELVMLDDRVPMVRERLGVADAPHNRYDRALAAAVAKYQKANGLKPTGQLNAATIASLNGPSREAQMTAILATMERWRWMPRNLGATHVALNIPDYHLQVMHNGEQVWKTRVVVGKPSQATPLITETMKFITVNPTWNVPQSIIYNELLPIYESTDPNVFARMGLKVERKRNGEIRVFQPPGERNALGLIRFNFPNKFLVYQHDTPEKHYFAHSKRAYSHGCMRVQDPMKYAEVLLTYALPRSSVSQQDLRRLLGGQERQIDFAQHIPVHISYQTAFVDEAGKLQFREDVYGLDKAVMAQLQGSERQMADVAMDRPADPNFQPTAQDVRRMHSAARGGGSPFSLFEQLFR